MIGRLELASHAPVAGRDQQLAGACADPGGLVIERARFEEELGYLFAQVHGAGV